MSLRQIDTWKLRGKKTYDIQLPYKYYARDYQLPFWEAMASGIKRAVLIWHRRAGKEKTCWNYLVTQAIMRQGMYYYLFPTYNQGRKILWDGMDKQGFGFLEHIPEWMINGTPHKSHMMIELTNGSKIQIIGTDKIDKIVGTNPIGCVFSEYSLQRPEAWEFIRPILRENDGWAIFNFTPRGHNHAKVLYDMAYSNPEWFCNLLTVDDTKVLTPSDVDKDRKEGMTEDYIQQEYYCSFNMGIEGSYYARWIQDMREEKRIIPFGIDKSRRVYTAWDIGYGDSTAIVMYQVVGLEIHVIDYYENHGQPLSHYVQVLKDKPYKFHMHFGPHDIDSHTFSSGLSTREVAADLGIDFTVLPTLKVGFEAGVDAARNIFDRLWIKENTCGQLIKCLEMYRKEYDEKNCVYKNRPLHDKHSHGADAFRYMAMAIKIYVDASRAGDIDDRQAEKWWMQYNPRFN